MHTQITFHRNGHALVKPEIQDGILAVFDIFEPLLQEKIPLIEMAGVYDEDASSRFLTLSPLDIVGLIQALYPKSSSPSGPPEHESTSVGSERPSTAGSSTLIACSSEDSSVLAPSTAPSTAEASVISNKDPGVWRASDPSTQVQKSPDPFKDGLEKESSGAGEVTLKDLPSQLRIVYSRLKNHFAHDKPFESVFSNNAWAPIYYSNNGAAISIGLQGHIRGSEESSAPPLAREQLEMGSRSRKYSALKVAILKLLSNENGSGIDDLIILARTVEDSIRHDPLETLLQAAMNRAQSRFDFGTSHEWWMTLESYRYLLSSDSRFSFLTVLQDLSHDLKTRVAAAAKEAEAYEVQCRSLDRMQQHHRRLLANIDQQRKALRVKMWYISDVRHSGTYEEALHVTRALRTMATSKRSMHPASVNKWARQRLRGSALHDQAEAQALEAIAAPKDQGGLSKLADEQLEITSKWMTRKSVENFCKGEERIHRFCHEIQRSVGKIAGASPLNNPVLWSSNLFKRERSSFEAQRLNTSAIDPIHRTANAHSIPFGHAPLLSPVLTSHGAPPRGLSFASLKARSPMTNTSGFWSPSQPSRPFTGPSSYSNQGPLPPTPTSPPRNWSNESSSPSSPLYAIPPLLPYNASLGGHRSHPSNDTEPNSAKTAFAEHIKQSLYSLLISDLGYLLWNYGSETDVWINEYEVDGRNESKDKQVTGEGGVGSLESLLNPPSEAARPRSSSQLGIRSGTDSFLLTGLSSSSQAIPTTLAAKSFPFVEAYATLLQNMSLTADPWLKLQLLHDLENMAIRSLQSQENHHFDPLPERRVNISFRNRSVPRTKATSLEEVIANCTERRAGTIRAKGPRGDHSLLDFVPEQVAKGAIGTDDVVDTLLSLFRDRKLRPRTLFRDLQYIAAFIPSDILDQTPKGKAFWDAGLAALALKEDLCESMVNRANEVTAYHISASKPSNISVDNPLATTTLRDAANLWLITAKEGSPVAARELGLFYLTHPKLLPRTTMAFSSAKDVFRSTMSNDAMSGNKEKGALDPLTFAIIFHWMEVAANGGDKDARDFLRGNGELSSGRG